MRRAAILERLEDGPQTAAALVARIYQDLTPALVAAARQSTLAQLDHLIEQGRVGKETLASGDRYYLI
jgi:hypothetical protein